MFSDNNYGAKVIFVKNVLLAYMFALKYYSWLAITSNPTTHIHV